MSNVETVTIYRRQKNIYIYHFCVDIDIIYIESKARGFLVVLVAFCFGGAMRE